MRLVIPPCSYEAIAARLYEGVLEPDAWHAALEGMRHRLGAVLFHAFTLDSVGGTAPESVSNLGHLGMATEHMRAYETHYFAHDPRMDVLMRMAPGQPMFDHEHISPQEAACNPVYADWLVPLGFRHTLGINTRREDGAREFCSFIRPRDAQPYSPDDQAFVRQLMPDLMRATQLRASMLPLSHKAALGLAALDTLQHGIIVVDQRRRVLHANAAAERMLSPTKLLCVQQGQLRHTHASPEAALDALIAQACCVQGKAGSLRARHSDGENDQLTINILPLRLHHPLVSLSERPLALAVLIPSGAPSPMDSALICDMLGLSPSETKLALLLAAGKSVKDFAMLDGCSWHTARTHARNLMRKTGCHRRLELTQMLTALHIR